MGEEKDESPKSMRALAWAGWSSVVVLVFAGIGESAKAWVSDRLKTNGTLDAAWTWLTTPVFGHSPFAWLFIASIVVVCCSVGVYLWRWYQRTFRDLDHMIWLGLRWEWRREAGKPVVSSVTVRCPCAREIAPIVVDGAIRLRCEVCGTSCDLASHDHDVATIADLTALAARERDHRMWKWRAGGHYAAWADVAKDPIRKPVVKRLKVKPADVTPRTEDTVGDFADPVEAYAAAAPNEVIRRMILDYLSTAKQPRSTTTTPRFVERGRIGTGQATNQLIIGDNLMVMQAMMPEHAGSFACVFADPPYGTVGMAEEPDGHKPWMDMMTPRLRCMRDLLAVDGSLWISANDRVVHHLRALLDELFGQDNLIAANVWQHRTAKVAMGDHGSDHEHLLVYAKDRARWGGYRSRLPLTEEQRKQYKNPDGDERGPWRAVPLSAPFDRPSFRYPITGPDGVDRHPPAGRCWRFSQEKFGKLLAARCISFGKDNRGQPCQKVFLSDQEGSHPGTIWSADDVGTGIEARREAIAAIGSDSPTFPKPMGYMDRVLRLATAPGDKILDAFAGTGTTGHAALALNAASIGGKPRSFVLIETEPQVVEMHTVPRLTAAITGYTDRAGAAMPGLSGGVRILALDI